MEHRSPLARAEEAKHRRDLVGEVDALIGGHHALTEAPWHPSRPGDQLLIMLEATDHAPGSTVLYEVIVGGDGPELRLAEVTPEGAAGGWYAGPPEPYGADPVEAPWMEAGPDRPTITRNGAIVHQGRHALPRPETTEPRLTSAAGPNGAVGLALVQEIEYTPAEMSALEQKSSPGARNSPPATTGRTTPASKTSSQLARCRRMNGAVPRTSAAKTVSR